MRIIKNGLLSAYIGGQLEVRDCNDKKIYRGEIKTAKNKSGRIIVTFSWCAEGKTTEELFPDVYSVVWNRRKEHKYTISRIIHAEINTNMSRDFLSSMNVDSKYFSPEDIGPETLCFSNLVYGKKIIIFHLPGSPKNINPAVIVD